MKFKYIAIFGICLLLVSIVGITVGVTASILSSEKEQFKSDWAEEEGISVQELDEGLIEDSVYNKYESYYSNLLGDLTDECIRLEIPRECASALNNLLKK